MLYDYRIVKKTRASGEVYYVVHRSRKRSWFGRLFREDWDWTSFDFVKNNRTISTSSIDTEEEARSIVDTQTQRDLKQYQAYQQDRVVKQEILK